MSIQVLVNALGQHLIADVKQVENTETGEILAYRLLEPRLVAYSADQETKAITVNFISTCAVAVTSEYDVRADHIVSILPPLPDVEEAYRAEAFPAPVAAEAEEGEAEVATVEVTE